MSIINNRIKEIRLQRGLTLLQLANLIGVKEATVHRYESGDIKNIKYTTLNDIADALNCSPIYLAGWVDDPTYIPDIDRQFTTKEIEIIRHYRYVDDYGKTLIDFVIKHEYKRSVNEHK